MAGISSGTDSSLTLTQVTEKTGQVCAIILELLKCTAYTIQLCFCALYKSSNVVNMGTIATWSNMCHFPAPVKIFVGSAYGLKDNTYVTSVF